jgi:uncharacterized protein (TIGR03435 family)
MRPFWFVFLAASALAQSPAPPAFEVASVKINELYRQDDRMTWRPSIESPPDSLTMRNVNMRMMVAWAWDIQRPKVSGPDWIDGPRYDIQAKAGQPAKVAEMRLMLQALLAERFKLEWRRETRQMEVLAVTVPKSGHKMKESAIAGDSATQSTQGPDGGATVRGAAIGELINEMSREVTVPVVDLTGLTGRFDFSINPQKYRAELISSLGTMSPAQRPSESEMIVTLMQNLLQGDLGLRMEPRKAAVEVFVVERGEKTPVAN